jgi:hypothetical protein
MTVGELICELKKYGISDLCRFFSKKGDKEHVKLVSWDKKRVYLTPHGELRLSNGELIRQLEECCSVEFKVYFLTMANEVAPISSIDVSEDEDFAIFSG